MFKTKKDIDRHVRANLANLNENERKYRGFTIAKLYYKINDFVTAANYVSEYISVYKDKAPAYKLLGWCMLKQNKVENALDYFQKSLYLDKKQPDILVEVCKILAASAELNNIDAEYWCKMAENEGIKNSSVEKLRQKLSNTQKSADLKLPSHNYSFGLNDSLKASENIEENKNQVQFDYLEKLITQKKFGEALKYILSLEKKGIDWNYSINLDEKNLKIVDRIINLKTEVGESIKWEYSMLVTIVYEKRLLATFSESCEIKKIQNIENVLSRFDQHLKNVSQILKSLGKERMTFEFLNHYRGQLYLYCASLLLQKLEYSKKQNIKEILKNVIFLLILSYQCKPPEMNLPWVESLQELDKICLDYFKFEGAFRCIQASRSIVSYINAFFGDEIEKRQNQNQLPDELQSEIEELSLNSLWRNDMYQKVFSNISKTHNFTASYFVNSSDVIQSNFIDFWSTVEQYEQKFEKYKCNSLKHITYLWLTIEFSNKRSQNFILNNFESMRKSKTASICNLTVLDLLSFLNATVIRAARYLEIKSSNFEIKNQGIILPYANIQNLLCTEYQSKWWAVVYELCNNAVKHCSNDLRQIIQNGCDAVRCVGEQKISIMIVLRMAKIFLRFGDETSIKYEKTLFYGRAQHLYQYALGLLKKGRADKKNIIFDYPIEDASSYEKTLNTFIEDGIHFTARKYFENAEYENCIDFLKGLDQPLANFYITEAHKKLISQRNNDSGSREDFFFSEILEEFDIEKNVLDSNNSCYDKNTQQQSSNNFGQKHQNNLTTFVSHSVNNDLDIFIKQISESLSFLKIEVSDFIKPEIKELRMAMNNLQKNFTQMEEKVNKQPATIPPIADGHYAAFSPAAIPQIPTVADEYAAQYLNSSLAQHNLQHALAKQSVPEMSFGPTDKISFKPTFGGIPPPPPANILFQQRGYPSNAGALGFNTLALEPNESVFSLYPKTPEQQLSQLTNFLGLNTNFAQAQFSSNKTVTGMNADALSLGNNINTQNLEIQNPASVNFPSIPASTSTINSNNSIFSMFPKDTISPFQQQPQTAFSFSSPFNTNPSTFFKNNQLTSNANFTTPGTIPVTTSATSSILNTSVATDKSSSSIDDSRYHENDEYDPRPDFQAIVQLPEVVDLKTGEENEEILFRHKAKLFRFADKEWKERGTGDVKILKNLQTGKIRLLMRRDITLKICANHLLKPGMSLIQPVKSVESKSFIWAADDYADEELKVERFCIRFKEPAVGKEFQQAFTKAVEEIEKSIEKSTAKEISTDYNQQVKNKTDESKPSKESINKNETEGGKKSNEDKQQHSVLKPLFGGFENSTTSPSSTESVFKNLQMFKPDSNSKLIFGNSFVFNKEKSEIETFLNKESSGNALSFGLVSQSTLTSNKENLNKQNAAEDNLDKSNVSEDNYESTAQFKPVIELPELVEIRTGEENENVLFEHRAKLLRYDKETNEWKERGLGNIKILQDRTNANKIRLLMRREKIEKICCNQYLWSDIQFIHPQSAKEKNSLMWIGNDYSDGELVTETLLIRFKTVDTCKQFHDIILDLQKKMKDEPSEKAKDENVSEEEKENLKMKTGFGDKFKPAEGSWSCSVCYVQNAVSAMNCIACQTARNGSENTSKTNATENNVATKLTFGFGNLEGGATEKTVDFNKTPGDSANNVFGSKATIDISNTFGLKPTTETTNVFSNKPNISPGNIFGGKPSSDIGNIFGSKPSSDSGNIFCSKPTINTGNIFGSKSMTESGSIFGGKTISDAPNIFENKPTSDATITFGNKSTIDTGKIFGSNPMTDTGNIFESKSVGTGNIFGGKLTSESGNIFGTKSTNDTMNIFGSKSTMDSASIFGNPSTLSGNSFESKETNSTSIFRNKSSDSTNGFDGKTSETKSDANTANSTIGFGDKFKPAEGSWSCKSCYVQNNADSKTCIACNNAKPGMESDTDKNDIVTTSSKPAFDLSTKSKFNFGFNFQPTTTTVTSNAFANIKQENESKIDGDTTETNTLNSTTASNNKITQNEKSIEKPSIFSHAAAFTMPEKSVFSTTPIAPIGDKISPFDALQDKKLSETFNFGKKEFNFNFNIVNSDGKAKSPLTKPLNVSQSEDKDTSSGEYEEEENNAWFTPVVHLDKVTVTTGEEDEEVLYCHRAKLFRFADKEWKERGLGDIKILKHKITQKLRIVMRREQVHKICLNHILTNEIDYKKKDDRSWLFAVADFSEGQLDTMNFCLRFKTKEIANDFMEAVKKALTDDNSQSNDKGNKTKDITSDVASCEDHSENIEPCTGCRGCDSDNFTFKDITNSEISLSEENPLPLIFKISPKAKKSFIKKSVLNSSSTISETDKKSDSIFDTSNKNVETSVSEEKKIDQINFGSFGTSSLNFSSQNSIFSPAFKSPFNTGTNTSPLSYSNILNFGSLAANNTNQTVTDKEDTERNKPIFGTTDISASMNKQNKNENIFAAKEHSFVDFASLAKMADKPVIQQPTETVGGASFYGLTQQDSFKHFSNNQSNISQNENSLNKTGNDEESNFDPYYKPIIELPKEIVVKTGEEDEEKLFGERATLFRYDATNKEWKERGVGELKILYHPQKKSYRLVLRREQIHKLVLNFAITADFNVNKMNNSPKAFCWCGMNYTDDNVSEYEKLAVRFKKVEIAEQFNEEIKRCIQQLQQNSTEQFNTETDTSVEN